MNVIKKHVQTCTFILFVFTCAGCLSVQSHLRAQDVNDRNLDRVLREKPTFSRFRKVPFQQVKIRDNFWSPRIKTIQDTTVPDLFDIAERQGKIDNLRIIAGRKDDGRIRVHNSPDSDIWKIMEGAAYTLAWREDPDLEQRLDELIELYAEAQADNGYINQMFMLPDDHPQSPKNASSIKLGYGADERFEGSLNDWPRGISQFYSTGHLLDAAVAHYRATGKTNFLKVAIGMADRIYEEFPPGEPFEYADHPQLGIGLVKLYEVTGDKKYLKLASHVVHNGHHGRPVDKGDGESTIPIRQQRKAWGHAVRINYLYSGATDVARHLEQPETREALNSLWHSIVDRRIYLHGGVGGPADHEQLADDWELEPQNAYSESCANIAHAEWNHRLNLMKGHAKYADLVEIEAYNGALSGLGVDGKTYLYCNPTRLGKENRRDQKSGVRKRYLFCCPSNLPTFVGGIARFAYAKHDEGLVVNQYFGNTVNTEVDGQTVTVHQETQYPWEGRVRLEVEPEQPDEFILSLRIPGWARTDGPHPSDLYRFADQNNPTIRLTVNGTSRTVTDSEKGYVHIERTWEPGDEVVLNMTMPVRRVHSHPNAIPTNGKAALMKGPVVYAIEGADNSFNVFNATLPSGTDIHSSHRSNLLGGVTVLTGTAGLNGMDKRVQFTAVPYYAWQNRGIHRMTVWLHDPTNRPVSYGKPATAPNVWKDRFEKNGPDKAVDGRLDTRWATDADVTEPWIEIDLEKPRKITSIQMFEAFAGRIQSHALEYRSDGEWKTIYRGNGVGERFTRRFDPVTVRKVRVNILKSSKGPTLKEIRLYGLVE